MRRRRSGWLAAIVLSTIIAACGGDNGTDPIDLDPLVQPFVGTWDAEVFTVTSDADPSIVADLMVTGTFNLNVQPSGLYTATLVFGGIPLVEIGQLTATTGFVTLRPNQGGSGPATSSFLFVQPDYLRLIGPTEFDFNLDQVLDPAEAYIELQRR